MHKYLLLLLTSTLASCTTLRPAPLEVPPSHVTECESTCTRLGMRLAAFVVVSERSGCVCEPEGKAMSSSVRGSAAAIAGAVIAEQEASTTTSPQSSPP